MSFTQQNLVVMAVILLAFSETVQAGEPRMVAQWEAPHRVNAVAISHDGKTVVAGGPHGRVSLWDVSTQELKRYALETHDDTTSTDISPDGRLFAVTGIEGSMRVFETASGRQVYEMGDHGSRLMRVRFSHDGTHIGTTCWDGVTRCWSIGNGAKRGETSSSMVGAGGLKNAAPTSGWVFPAGPRHDGQHLVNGPDAVVAWDLACALRVGGWKNPAEVWEVDASPDGKTVAVGDAEGNVRVLNRTSGTEVRQWKLEGLPRGNGIVGLAYFAKGEKLAGITMSGHGAVWNVVDGAMALEMNLETNGFVSFDVTSTGQAVLSDWTKTIRVFDLTEAR